MTEILPLNLSILRTVQEFRKIPLDLLARRLGRRREEVEQQVTQLEREGVVRREGESVLQKKPGS